MNDADAIQRVRELGYAVVGGSQMVTALATLERLKKQAQGRPVTLRELDELYNMLSSAAVAAGIK